LRMNQGKIIEYIDQGKFVCTLCLQDKGTRLHLLTPLNREVNISPKRALLLSKGTVDTGGSREALLNRLNEIEALRKMLTREVHVKELWELVRDGQESFEYADLAQLYFGEKITDDHISALVRALFDDRLYFKMKEGHFLPHSEEIVEQTIKQREEEARRETRLKEGSTWLKNRIQNKVSQAPSCKDAVIDLLVELALYGKEAPNFNHTKDLLLRAGITDVQRAKSLLVDLGVWGEDENLDLYRLNINTSFSEAALNASEKLTKVGIEEGEREDLRDLNAFTIDGPDTKDFDDALSIEITSDSILLGVHISDVASAIPPDSLLDKEASQRGSSLYLPSRSIPMIPPNLSQDTLSLRKDCDRPAISLLCRFDKDFGLLDYRFALSLVRVRRQLTYEEVNNLYSQEDVLEQAYELSQVLRKNRVDQGALILSLPELWFKIHPDSSISLETVDQNTPSRIMVAEFMILYNWLAAKLFREHDIPVLYRSQEKPSEELSIGDEGYLYYVFKQRRKLNPLIINTDPLPHAGLGLDMYTNVSSPIRRYLDLAIQRQMRRYLLEGSFVYGKEQLEEIRMAVQPLLRILDIVKRNRIRYWTQKYLLSHIGERFPAVILDTLKNRYRILLTDFLLVAEMKRENGQEFHQGQQIMVKIRKCDPWNDLLNLECK
jgi:exoribonuclease-2